MNSDASPETQEPTKPLTPSEIYERALKRGEQELLEAIERNNPKYLDAARAESEARIAKRKADLKAAEEREAAKGAT